MRKVFSILFGVLAAVSLLFAVIAVYLFFLPYGEGPNLSEFIGGRPIAATIVYLALWLSPVIVFSILALKLFPRKHVEEVPSSQTEMSEASAGEGDSASQVPAPTLQEKGRHKVSRLEAGLYAVPVFIMFIFLTSGAFFFSLAATAGVVVFLLSRKASHKKGVAFVFLFSVFLSYLVRGLAFLAFLLFPAVLIGGVLLYPIPEWMVVREYTMFGPVYLDWVHYYFLALGFVGTVTAMLALFSRVARATLYGVVGIELCFAFLWFTHSPGVREAVAGFAFSLAMILIHGVLAYTLDQYSKKPVFPL